MYPTAEQVEAASKTQLAYWYRFLPSPDGIDDEGLENQIKIVNRITERFNEMGGFDPELSKRIGWDN